MNSWGKKIYIFCACTFLLTLLMIFGINLYQPPSKTLDLYKSALESYNIGEYSKSYYLFSKVIITSDLKPLAIYHQGVAADEINDIKSAIKQYRFFLLLYPKHVLSQKVKYKLAIDLVKTGSHKAKKYFLDILKYALFHV